MGHAAIRRSAEWLAGHQAKAEKKKPAQNDPPVMGFASLSPKQRTQALGRLKTGEMNKTEAEYDAFLMTDVTIAWRKFEGVKLRLADNTFYSPDFFLMRTDGRLEVHEVKGHWEDDARVKIKVAAAMFPFAFVAVTKVPKKDGGGWKKEEF